MLFQDKRVLITGGTGSLGKSFVRRLLTGEQGTPSKIIILSRDEAKQHDMRMHYQHKMVSTDEITYKNFMNALEFRIGDVRSYEDVYSATQDVDIIINAAALKQVPACEYFPEQAVYTNCLGAENIVRAIRTHHNKVETVIVISTDKACKPVNTMGLTKAIQERIFITANILNPDTRFVCVRYGNVLASRGSVIPLFQDQIRNGGPVTITHENMTRFLLSLDHAVDTIFAAVRYGKRGEIFVPKIPSAKVANIAKTLIGNRNIKIAVTGIRPGEKMHEIMVSDEEAERTRQQGDYLAIRPMLPELLSDQLDAPSALNKEYSSQHPTLSLEETYRLLSQHRLLMEDSKLASITEEILR